MLRSIMIHGLIGLPQVLSAQPLESETSAEFHVTHVASDHFPHAKGDLKPFDVDVQFKGYGADTKLWLQSLDPSSGTNDEQKAIILTEVAYAKPFNREDADMALDVHKLLATVAGNVSESDVHSDSDGTTFKLASGHAVAWSACAAFFSCVSGTTCSLSIDIGKAPRSKCEPHGGSNCCISWSNYNVRAGFFSRTWTNCNAEVNSEKKSKVSCEGYGSSSQGGDVCLSNRATGCT